MTDVCHYADFTTLHACELYLKSFITRLQHGVSLAIEWFESTYRVLNRINVISFFQGANAGKVNIWENKQQNLLDVLIDRDLKSEYVSLQCIRQSSL